MRRRIAAGSVESWSWCTRRAPGHEQDAPAGVVQAPAEVGLVRVDEEVAGRASRPARRPRAAPASRSTAPSPPRAPGRRGSAPRSGRGMNTAAASAQRESGQPPGAGGRLARRWSSSCAPAAAAPRVGLERVEQRARGALVQLGVLVQQQAVAPARRRAAAASRSSALPVAPLERDQPHRPDSARAPPRAEPSSDALSSTSSSCSTPGGWVRSIAARQASR